MTHSPSPQATKKQHAVVIGAGIAGLSTAALLAKDGFAVTIVEKNGEVGGRAGDYSDPHHPGFRWDTGPSWYLMPEAFDHFFELMGTSTAEQLELKPLDPGYRVFSGDQQPVDIPVGREAAIELFESIETGAGAQLREYLESAQETYDIAIKRFLYTTFSALGPILHPEVLSRAGKLLVLLSQSMQVFVNTRFKDTRLRQILSYPAVFLSSSPDKTPALYHLMSHTDLIQGVQYPLGGFSAVVQAFHKIAVDNGVKIRLNTAVTSILISTNSSTSPAAKTGAKTSAKTKATHATGVAVVNEDGTAENIAADFVVSGADLHHTENFLLPPSLRTYPEKYWEKRDPGIGAVLVLLGVEGKLPQLEHHNLIFSEHWDEDFSVVFEGPRSDRPLNASQSIYVCMTSATDPEVAPAGQENLFILVPTPPAADLGHGDCYGHQPSQAVQDIAAAAIVQVAQKVGIPDFEQRILVQKTIGPADFVERYNSWRAGAIGPAHTLNQSAFLRGQNTSKKVAGLYYAGSTTVPGVGVPMCLISAENVIKRIHADTSPGPLAGLG